MSSRSRTRAGSPSRLTPAAQPWHPHTSPTTPVDFRAAFDAQTWSPDARRRCPFRTNPDRHPRMGLCIREGAARRRGSRARTCPGPRANRQVAALDDRLNNVDAELKKIHPVYYRYLRYHPPYGNPFNDGVRVPSSPSPSASRTRVNLFHERVQILATLADIGASAARRHIFPLEGPIVVAKPIAPAVRVDTSSRATVPILVVWAIGLVVLLAGRRFDVPTPTRSVASGLRRSRGRRRRRRRSSASPLCTKMRWRVLSVSPAAIVPPPRKW